MHKFAHTVAVITLITLVLTAILALAAKIIPILFMDLLMLVMPIFALNSLKERGDNPLLRIDRLYLFLNLILIGYSAFAIYAYFY